MTELRKAIGIVSYLPDDSTKRQSRISRLSRLFSSLSRLLPNIDIIVVAQNWKDYVPVAPKNNIIIVSYTMGLGILRARNILRAQFLEREYDYLIMFDDDAIPEESKEGAIAYYLKKMDENPRGFAFVVDPFSKNMINPYYPSQLNFCAISKYIYNKEPMPQVDPQKNEAYEDRLFSTLLHHKYADLEFSVPEGVRSVHFKNPQIQKYGGEVPSTWAYSPDRNWGALKTNTLAIEKYIVQNGDIPEEFKSDKHERYNNISS